MKGLSTGYLSLIILLVVICLGILGGGPFRTTESGVAPQFKIDEIRVSVTVVDDKSRAISDLPQAAFTVLDGKVTQQITSFNNKDLPASVAIVFDMSGSLSDGKGRARHESIQAIQSLAHFVRESESRNEYFIIGFNDNVSILLDGIHDLQKVVDTLASIGTSQFKGQSSFFDACYTTLQRLKAATYSKKIVILVSDGEDTYSRAEMDDIQRLLLEDSVVVYAFYSGPYPVKPRPDGVRPRGVKNLEKLTEIVGGQVFYPKSSDEFLEKAGQMTAEVRSEYLIGFKPSKPLAPGKCYSFKLRLVSPSSDSASANSLRVRSRDSYCLSGPKH